MDLDDDAAVGGGFVNLNQCQRLRAAQLGDPDRTHQGNSMARSVTFSSPRGV